MINEMNARIKELEQQIHEKDIANDGLQAKVQGLQAKLSVTEREKDHLNDQARTLQVVGILLGCMRGDDIVKAVPEAVLRIKEEREHITEHAVHAAKCQLINDIQAAYVPYDKLTAEQVISLICAEKEEKALGVDIGAEWGNELDVSKAP
jgi:hypothetical protein